MPAATASSTSQLRRHRKRAVHETSGNTRLLQRIYLVFHKRDKRRYHERPTAHRKRGHLVADGLARARGHDGQHVAASQDGIDDLPLVGAEIVVAEIAFQDVLRCGHMLFAHLGFSRFCPDIRNVVPTLEAKAVNSAEFAVVVSYQDGFMGNCGGGNERIVMTDSSPPRIQFIIYARIYLITARIKWMIAEAINRPVIR